MAALHTQLWSGVPRQLPFFTRQPFLSLAALTSNKLSLALSSARPCTTQGSSASPVQKLERLQLWAEGNLYAAPATLKLNPNPVLENQPADEPESARESLSGWGLRRLEV
jgi:hypothetical protein